MMEFFSSWAFFIRILGILECEESNIICIVS